MENEEKKETISIDVSNSRDAKGRFIKGCKVGALKAGAVVHTRRKQFLVFTTKLMEYYDENKIIEMLEDVEDVEKRLYFIEKFAELHLRNIKHNDYIKLALLARNPANNISTDIKIQLPSFEDEDDEDDKN
jgi:hypothetical protein